MTSLFEADRECRRKNWLKQEDWDLLFSHKILYSVCLFAEDNFKGIGVVVSLQTYNKQKEKKSQELNLFQS